MINRHFFKTLVAFTAMILLGLIGILLVGHFSEGEKTEDIFTVKTGVAK